MPREADSQKMRWFDVEPCYVYHPLNAYEEGERVVLDVTRHPKMFATEHRGPNEGAPTLDRWSIDLSAGKLLEERLDDRGQEFPRVDERLVGRRHRFGYAVEFQDAKKGEDVSASHGVIKHDLEVGSSQIRSFGADHEADEFAFVPRAQDAAEDDGVLMGFVYDRTNDRSDLLVLDAGSTRDSRGPVHLPVRVPHGFHGSWVPAARSRHYSFSLTNTCSKQPVSGCCAGTGCGRRIMTSKSRQHRCVPAETPLFKALGSPQRGRLITISTHSAGLASGRALGASAHCPARASRSGSEASPCPSRWQRATRPWASSP